MTPRTAVNGQSAEPADAHSPPSVSFHPRQTPSLLLSPGESSVGTAEVYQPTLPPSFSRQESVQVAGGSSKLPFLHISGGGKSLPHAPQRTEDEGVTAATFQHQHHPRRRASTSSRRSASSLDLADGPAPASRSASRRSFGVRRSTAVSERAKTKGKQPRDLLQEAADAVDQNGVVDEAVLMDGTADPESSEEKSKAKKLAGFLNPTRLVDLHELRPDLRAMSLLPTAVFPGQGSGDDSEFLQHEPVWARNPYKWMYMAYFGLSVGLVFLPYFAIASINPDWRARSTWTWKRSTLVRLYRHGTRLTFRTHTSLSRDLSKAVPHSSTLRCKFVWIPATPDGDIRGELKRAMEKQQIPSVRTCGFWYGEPLKEDNLASINPAVGEGATTTGVGRRAGVDEKVVFHLHGGAYWIGTAHEKDVTAAVNTEVLRYLDEIYKSGKSKASPGNRCTRSLSLDYRLCVPHRPRLGSYPAALLDAVAGYLYLTRYCGFKAKNIIVAGDSAGGNLALALCRYLRDEKVEAVPGCLLLLSPWADISRSHAGPLSAPNVFSSVHQNRDVDIISPSTAFRNTAVQAFLGDLEAREAYRNPYLSSCSLQLPPENGGDGPDWGFEGFSKRTYIVSGSGEISNDQHLTLAHRMASGTLQRIPTYTGDQLSKGGDPYEMAARLTYPRPSHHQIALWPSARGTPADIRGAKSGHGYGDAVVDGSNDGQAGQEHARVAASDRKKQAEGEAVRERSRERAQEGKAPPSTVLGQSGKDILEPVRSAGSEEARAALREHDGDQAGLPTAYQSDHVAGRGPKENAVKTADWAPAGSSSHNSKDVVPPASASKGLQKGGEIHIDIPLEAKTLAAQNRDDADPRRGEAAPEQRKILQNASLAPPQQRPPLMPMSSGAAFLRAQSRSALPTPAGAAGASGLLKALTQSSEVPAPLEGVAAADAARGGTQQESYFGLGGEDRRVWLDEVRDGVHDLLLFPWHEPERGDCWRRIAQWIDEDCE